MSKFKKTTSVSLVMVITCLLFMNTTAFAMNMENVSLIQEQSAFLNQDSYFSDEFYDELRKIGFLDKEIMELYQKEANQTGQIFKIPETLAEKTKISHISPESAPMARINGFPSNPKEGDVHTESYSINFDTLARALGWTGGGMGITYILANASKTAVARAIVASTSLGILSAALGIAGVIFGEASRIHTGMTVKIQYHYIYSNNMIVEWVVGPMQHSFW